MTSLWASASPFSFSAQAHADALQLIPLPSLAVLQFTGAESAKFLQGQTTADFREIEQGAVLPGAVCSLKGRVLFSFTAVPQQENMALVFPQNQFDDAFAHLKKFSVFSKTQLHDHRNSIALLGVMGEKAAEFVARIVGAAPAAQQAVHHASGAWAACVSSNAAPQPRYLLALPAAEVATQWAARPQNACVLTEEAWWAADICAGFASVFSATRDAFQPQELNYGALSAVSYNKGCYTGQEVVARLYFRGKLKQRVYRFSMECAANAEIPAPNHAVFSQEKSVGHVVMAARSGENTVELLAVVKNQAVREAQLTLEGSNAALVLLALPYAVDADKEE